MISPEYSILFDHNNSSLMLAWTTTSNRIIQILCLRIQQVLEIVALPSTWNCDLWNTTGRVMWQSIAIQASLICFHTSFTLNVCLFFVFVCFLRWNRGPYSQTIDGRSLLNPQITVVQTKWTGAGGPWQMWRCTVTHKFHPLSTLSTDDETGCPWNW